MTDSQIGIMDRYLLSKRANGVISASLIAVLLLAGATQSLTAWAQSDELHAAFRQYQSLEKQGKYTEAIPYAQKFIEFAKEEFSETHQFYAAGLNNLASLHEAQGRYAEAEPLYKRALAIHEKALGPDHPSTAASLNNLAVLYKTQGRYEDAEPLFKRALAIKEKALGPDHPDTATSLNNLAELYRAQGRYEDAEPLYKRALAIKENALGPDHPSTATSLNNLAWFHKATGDKAASLDYIRRAVSISRTRATRSGGNEAGRTSEPFAVARTYPISPQGGCEKTQTCLTMAASPSRNTLAAPPRPRDGLVGSFYATYGVLQQR